MVHYYNTSLQSDMAIHFVYHYKPSQQNKRPSPAPKKSDVERLLDGIETVLRKARPDIFNMDAQISEQ